MNYYLITDTHFNHNKIIDYCDRPLDYEQRIEYHLDNMPRDGVLIHLGDICIGNDAQVHERYIQTLPYKKWLIRGNHDHKSTNWYLTHGWDWVGNSMSLHVNGLRVLLSHRPEVIKVGDTWLYDVNVHGHFHNSDHRVQEPELKARMTERHKLLAVEFTNYHLVNLADFVSFAEPIVEIAE